MGFSPSQEDWDQEASLGYSRAGSRLLVVVLSSARLSAFAPFADRPWSKLARRTDNFVNGPKSHDKKSSQYSADTTINFRVVPTPSDRFASRDVARRKEKPRRVAVSALQLFWLMSGHRALAPTESVIHGADVVGAARQSDKGHEPIFVRASLR
jgi:hypothetical protein